MTVKEDMNVMGSSSSTPGTGPIDTYDPLLRKRKDVLRRMQKATKYLRKSRGNANRNNGTTR